MAGLKKHRGGRLGEQSSSFDDQNAGTMAQLRRPQTLPDLVSYHKLVGTAPLPEVTPRQPPKLLLKVTMLGSLEPVQVIMTQESAVGDLVSAAVRQYVKQGRRPVLPTTDPSEFDLHYSQFSLESLDREATLMELGSRNFLLCPRKSKTTVAGGSGNEGSVTTPFASCSKQADKISKSGFNWFKFMDFMQ